MATSADFFRENAQLFSNPRTEAERFNLYGGLINLADQIDQMDRKIRNIEDIVVRMANLQRQSL